ncbi:BadF/BadG/BcrA/BcrD ATPase family protein [Lacrimispora sp.]|uniref:BadF/BadG/BcrA/BcrD ATPase family protein n=1 Tax=Lacrimispora sp. TaxID=2719234 RepID=UPI00289DF685|nr:BadF/BadG/BcrA/BcrD ATPase family protein [Lacrimispora sp.]
MKYLLSVDGGGTKTEFYISDLQGNMIDTFTTGSTSIKSVGLDKSYDQLKAGIERLKETYKITPDNILMGVFGMSGCDSDNDYQMILDQILSLGFTKDNVHLCNDGVLAFYAQTQEPGIVVIAGTGSIVIGIDKQGEVIRSGGWGYHFSDIGSGYWIGCEILKRTLLYCDNCYPYAPVFEQVRGYFQAESYTELPYIVTEIKDINQIAGLAYEVVKAADEQEELSIEILKDGAKQLADQVVGMVKQMDLSEAPKIVFSGGVLKSKIYQDLLASEIRQLIPSQEIQFYVQKNKPSYGGIKLAQRLLDKEKEIVLQVFTGGYLNKETTYEEVESKLKPILENVRVTKVIIGWTVDEELYKKIKLLVHMYQAELYLWMPVFSETGLLEPVSFLQDFQGEEVKSYRLNAGENFEFYCPNVKQNRESVKHIYEKHFSKIGFDGIFLDKIRYSSFSNKITGVFSCFCPECMKKYQERQLDADELRMEMDKVIDGLEGYDRHPLKCLTYEDGSYRFDNPIWKKFFDCKADFIYDSLKEITGYFRGQGLKIGMDVLSPFLTHFTGQDLSRLKGLTDFMKPMMYRITCAPAGLPFEYDSFLTGTTSIDTDTVRREFNQLLGIKPSGDNRFDLDFVKSELDIMERMDIPVYCGIEVNRIKDVVPADPDYIKDTINSLSQTNIKGFVLSWDILSAPEENIEAVYHCFGGRGEMQ